METTFTAPDIHCDGCAASINKVLSRQAGVERVAVDIGAKRVAVTFDEAQTNREALAETLTDIGFPPSDDRP